LQKIVRNGDRDGKIHEDGIVEMCHTPKQTVCADLLSGREPIIRETVTHGHCGARTTVTFPGTTLIPLSDRGMCVNNLIRVAFDSAESGI